MSTTVEIGDRVVAVATANGNGDGVKSTTAHLPEEFAGLETAARAEVLKQALQKCGINGKKFNLVIPRRQAIIREFELPPGEDDEHQQMIRFQLERELPLPVEDVYFSYKKTVVEGGKHRIVAVAVPRDVLDPVLESLEVAGWKPAGVFVSCFGLASFGPIDKNAAVVAVTNGHAEIVVTSAGEHAFSRSALVPNRSGEILATEVERTLLSFSGNHDGSQVESVTLAAGGDEAKSLADTLAKHLGRDVGTFTGDCALEASNAAGVSMTVSRRPEAMPDILHPPIVKKQFKVTKKHRIGVIIAVGVISMFVGASWIISDLESELETLNLTLKDHKPRVEEVRSTMEKIKVARQWGDQRFAWIDFIDDLSQRIDHSKVVIMSLVIEESGTVQLQGKSRTQDAVTRELLPKLRESSFFRAVNFNSTRANSDRSPYRWNFLIEARLKGFDTKKRGKR